MTASNNRGLVALGAIVHLVVTAVVWRDIGRRSAGELRGSKALWQLLTAANTGNSLVYLLVGRRRPS